MKPIRRIAVLGAGTMGSRIAAHFANAGIPALLLDLVLPDQPNRNAAAQAGIQNALKQKPGGFFTETTPGLVTPGNFEDHLPELRHCDWIIEAVAENLNIKRTLLEKVAAVRSPGAILSTNTSGIPLSSISVDFSHELRQHFLGTHFFNPPRYLHLVEIIPGADTLPEVLTFVSDFCDRRLGKGAVPCKDTPNFIANRIGSFFGATVHKLTVEDDYSIEEVDFLTGPLIGLPKSATYRLMDIVGLDVWDHVTRNLYDLVPHDPYRDRFVVPEFFRRMIEQGFLGEKRGQGFYKRVGKGEIQAIDWKTLEYHAPRPPRLPAVDSLKLIDNLGNRLRALLSSPDRAGTFLWKLLSDLFLYSAAMIPEISDRVVEIDRAMRWGYAHPLGPFGLWDLVGVRETVARLETEGRAVPESVQKMLYSGATSFYRAADREGTPHTEYFDLVHTEYRTLEERSGILVLGDLKRARGVVRQNAGASLIDLGDGALCVEFHSKMNTIGEDIVEMIHAGLEETERNFEAMILANQGQNFSVGANLMLVLLAAQEGEWEELEAAVRRFQQVNLAIKYAAKPVVAAPFGMTLGAGCELVLHAARVQASAECYLGLVETSVGLIPAGGGTKEFLLRLGDARKAFERIGYSKVSGSAAEAREWGVLQSTDAISMNPERLIADAKGLALSLAPAWTPGAARTNLRVGGAATYALLKTGLYLAQEGGYITEYDMVVGDKLAYVLSGGNLTGEQVVSEQYLLDLEREAFLSLCGRPETQERMRKKLGRG